MSRAALVLLGCVVMAGVTSIETTSALLVGLKDLVLTRFDVVFISTATLCLGLAITVGIYPPANLRLGPDDGEPEFPRIAWFSMLFSAGLASGLLYWAAAEPLLHWQDNPLLADEGIDAATPEAVRVAMRITLLHWGLHGWAMYVVGGLAIGLAAHRYGHPLTLRSALVPLLGPKWVDRWPGRSVDFLALLGTIFGVATSVGLSAAALNATLNSLFGLELAVSRQIAIIFVVSALGILSAISGVSRGVRRLSEINLWVSLVFLAGFLALGPTSELLALVASSAVDYLREVIPLGMRTARSEAERNWQGDWTVFYWGWWLAWMPFVSIFIAGISKGRTVREFVAAVLGVPTLVVVVWMVLIGGTSLHHELSAPGSISEAVAVDYSLGAVAVIRALPLETIHLPMLLVATFLLFTWLITSLDSATIVVCRLVETPGEPRHQVLWGIVLAAVTTSLLAVGGIPALQATSIAIGLPLAGVLLLVGVALAKQLLAR